MFIECEAFALSRDVGDGALSTFLFRDPSTSGQVSMDVHMQKGITDKSYRWKSRPSLFRCI
jgi:hypothetical protein